MAYLCSKIAVTWYDGLYPSESGAVVLLAADELIDESSPLSGSVEQLVQRVDYVRGEAPDFFPRGSRSTALEWDRVRPAARHDAALILGFEAAAEMPSVAGWVRVDLPDYGRAWVITPAAVRRTAWRYDVRAGHLVQRWSIDQGIATEIATTAEAHAWLWEDGTEILWEDDTYIALETAP